jgi:hypothetical protein
MLLNMTKNLKTWLLATGVLTARTETSMADDNVLERRTTLAATMLVEKYPDVFASLALCADESAATMNLEK